jgi:hypothetical protein
MKFAGVSAPLVNLDRPGLNQRLGLAVNAWNYRQNRASFADSSLRYGDSFF